MYPSFPHTTFVQSYELNLGVKLTGKKQWHQLLNYPRFGLSFFFTDLGNNKILGQQFCLVPIAVFPIIRNANKKFQCDVKAGMGASYFTRIYDSIKNPENFSVGEHFTWQVDLGFITRYALGPSAFLQAGAMWMHSSDSHTVLPNVGINTFALNAGVVIYPLRNNVITHHFDTLISNKKIFFSGRFSAGWQKRGGAFGPAGGPSYPVYTGSVFVSKIFAHVVKLNTGFTYHYYQNYYDFIIENNLYPSLQKLKASSFIWFFGGELLMGRVAFCLEPGINLYKPAYQAFWNQYEKKSKVDYYEKQILAMRIGLNFYLFNPDLHPHNNAFIGCFVNANSGQAEFMEFTAGYVF